MQSDFEQLSQAGDPDWQALEDRLARFARLARSEASQEEVAREMLECAVGASVAVGATLWVLDESGLPKTHCIEGARPVTQSEDPEEQRRLVLRSMLTRRQAVIPAGAEGEQPNPSDYPILRSPVLMDREPVALVEIVQRPGVDADALAGNLRYVSLLVELYSDRLRRHELRGLQRREAETERFNEFLYALHRAPSPEVLASELANEGRRLLGCDRVSVALGKRGRSRVVAVSGVDAVNRRSAAVRALDRLVTRVASTGEALWYESATPDCPPQVEEALSAHLDESHASRVAVIPLRGPIRGEGSTAPRGPKSVLGAMVVESFEADRWVGVRDRVDEVARQAGLALANALLLRRARRFPLLGGRGAVTGESTRIPSLRWFAAAVLVALAAAAFWVEIDYDLSAEGALRPVTRRHVFAPLDGQVAEVLARHGDLVEAGQPIARMTSPELELQLQKIQGEHDATLQRASAIESAMLEQGATRQRDPARLSKLAAEQEELRQLFRSQQERLRLLREQQERLVLRSPIAGEVLTWRADETLLNRPVQRGQSLLTVADLGGAWEAEIDVPDEDAGPLLELLEDGASEPEATIELALDRGTEHRGRIIGLTKRVERSDQGGAVLRARVAIDSASLANPRPDATVYARVHCGRRSVFYVWCHDIIERVQGWFLL